MEQELNLYGVWEVIAKRWLLIILVPLLAVIISILLSLYVLTPHAQIYHQPSGDEAS